MYRFIIARQQSCRKVMFSQESVYGLRGGGGVGISGCRSFLGVGISVSRSLVGVVVGRLGGGT